MLGVSIETFTHKGVEEVFRSGRSRNIGAEFHKRMRQAHELDARRDQRRYLRQRLARGSRTSCPQGDRSGTFAMSVSGNRRLTFRFEHGDEGDILGVDFEDYH